MYDFQRDEFSLALWSASALQMGFETFGEFEISCPCTNCTMMVRILDFGILYNWTALIDASIRNMSLQPMDIR